MGEAEIVVVAGFILIDCLVDLWWGLGVWVWVGSPASML